MTSKMRLLVRPGPARPEANYHLGKLSIWSRFSAGTGRGLTLWKTFDLVTFFDPARPEANTLENYRFGHVFRPGPAGE